MTGTVPPGREQAESEARRWIARMASHEMDAAELAGFRAWRAADPAHDRAFEDQRALWRALGPRPVRTPDWHVGEPYGARPIVGRHRLRRWQGQGASRPRRAAAAAGLAAAAALVLTFGTDIALMLRADHRSGAAVESVVLADGSRVMLDADSAIAVNYDGAERRVDLLRGDAWFDVAHGDDRPFRVAALDGVTQDVGTAFEVRRGDGAVIVAVTQGVVDVRSPAAGAALRLTISQRARYARGGAAMRLANVAPDEIAAWRQGEILLDDATPAQAVAAIARYRSMPVFIMGSPAADRRISGVFRTDRPDEAIGAVARMGRFSVHRMGGILFLRPIG